MDKDFPRVAHDRTRQGLGNSPLPWIAGAAFVGLALAATRARSYDFEGRVVLITGASRGLGLVLARELADRGAYIGMLARDAVELERARESLPSGAPVELLPADVTAPMQIEQAVNTLVARFGAIDVLINNAGQILSSPFEHTTRADFHAMMNVHFWGTLNMTRAVLDYLPHDGGARIVNVCSIGGRIGVPHLSAYCASKFAQSGLSAVMAEELRAKHIRVTTVLPGLMRTGSYRHAWFKGDHANEYAVFSLISGLPGTSMSATRAARTILRAAGRGDAEVILPFSVRQIARAAAMVPNTAAHVLSATSALLPGPGANVPIQGRELDLKPAVAAAITLAERAGARNNER